MNSCVPPFRRIASNLLWTPEGIVRDPLVVFDRDGVVRFVECCADPDRQPFAEFRAGLLVPGFPREWRAAFEGMQARAATPLPELLAALVSAREGIPVVLSGLDYDALRLLPGSRIDPLFPF